MNQIKLSLPSEVKNKGALVLETVKSFLGDREGIVVAMRIYMDESNTHDAGKYVAVSTAWASPEVWGSWTSEWLEKIKPLKYYHAVELHGLNEQCEGWTRAQADELVIRCLPIIRDHKIEGAVAVFDKLKLAQMLAHRPDVMAKLDHEYFVGFIWAVTRVMRDLKKRGETEISFFHEMNSFESRAHMHFASLMRREGLPNATLSFGSKEGYPPLQCADIFAYEAYQQMKLDPTMVRIRKPWLVINETNNTPIRVNALIADEALLKVLANTLIDWYDSSHAK